MRLVFVRQVSQQGWPSGHVYKGDTDIFHIAKTCTQYFHVSRPAHPLLHSLDLSHIHPTDPCITNTHTQTHHTMSLPNPLPLHRNFCMWTTHTARCRYRQNIYFLFNILLPLFNRKNKNGNNNGKNHFVIPCL